MTTPSVMLTGRIARPVKAFLLLAAVGFVGLWGIGTYERLTGPLPDCSVALCDNIEFSAQDVRLLEQLNLPAAVNHQVWQSAEVPYSIGFFVIAALIFWRRSDHAVGLLLSIAMVYAGAMLYSGADDPLRRAYPELRSLVSAFDIFGMVSLVLLLYTFPDGRFVGKRSKLFLAGAVALLIAAPLMTGGSSRLRGPGVPPLVTALWLMLFALVCAVGLRSQIFRFRHQSSPIQRQQTKWVLVGLAGQAVVVLIWGYLGYFYPPGEPTVARVVHVLIATPVILLLSFLVPITVAFAILRYHLFDIDRLINRALVYGAVSGSLAVLYFGGVVVLQGVLGGLGVDQSPLAVVLSTLLIVALFTPLRRWVQNLIDRRFYRRRYDLQITLAAFGMQLRDRFDLDSVVSEMLGLADDVLNPEHVSLWIKPVGRDSY